MPVNENKFVLKKTPAFLRLGGSVIFDFTCFSPVNH